MTQRGLVLLINLILNFICIHINMKKIAYNIMQKKKIAYMSGGQFIKTYNLFPFYNYYLLNYFHNFL